MEILSDCLLYNIGFKMLLSRFMGGGGFMQEFDIDLVGNFIGERNQLLFMKLFRWEEINTNPFPR